MSPVSEALRESIAEANEPEPDEDEANEAAEDEREQEPEQEPEPEPPSDALAEVDFAKIEKLAERYGKGVGPILAAGRIPLGPCPCCNIPGLVLPFDPNAADDQMRKAAIEAYLGEAEPGYRDAGDAEVCATCDGWGEVKTGAKTQNGRLKVCIFCNGLGWVTKTLAGSSYTPQPQPPYPGAEQSYTPPPLGMPDAWNRPAGHPHWGLDPSTIGA